MTHDPKHLWRAWKFAEFAVGPEGYRHTTYLAALCCMAQSQRFDGFSSVGPGCVGRSCGMYRRSPTRSSSASRARCASSPTCVASGTPPTRRPSTALSASPAAGSERAPTNNQHFNVTWLDHSSPRQSKGLVVGARSCASCSPSSLSSSSSSSSSSLVSTRSTGCTTSAPLRCSSSPGALFPRSSFALFFVFFADLLLSVSAADVCFGPPWSLLA